MSEKRELRKTEGEDKCNAVCGIAQTIFGKGFKVANKL